MELHRINMSNAGNTRSVNFLYQSRSDTSRSGNVIRIKHVHFRNMQNLKQEHSYITTVQ